MLLAGVRVCRCLCPEWQMTSHVVGSTEHFSAQRAARSRDVPSSAKGAAEAVALAMLKRLLRGLGFPDLRPAHAAALEHLDDLVHGREPSITRVVSPNFAVTLVLWEQHPFLLHPLL
jgi:hypothetical protein